MIQHAGLLAAGLVVGGLLIEIAARVLADPPPLQQELRSPPPVEPDPVLGWRRPPGRRFTLTRGKTTREIAINAEGFRDAERGRDKPAGVARVVVLGDSFTEALETDRERTFPRLLEQGLDAGGRVEVLTFGMRGYGTAQEYLTLRHRALAYRPDAVVLAFFVGNDVYDNGLAYSMRYRARPGPFFTLDGPGGALTRADVSPEEAARALTAGQSRLRQALSRVSAVLWPRLHSYGLVMGRLQAVPIVGPALQSAGLGAPVNPHDADVYAREERPELTHAWRVTEALLVEMARLTREQGALLLVAIIPHPVQFPGYLEMYRSRIDRRLEVPDAERPSRRVREILSARDIAHVDLLPLFRAHLAGPAPRDLYLREDGHFTAEGHRLAAHAIRCALVAHHFLSTAASCPPS
ncbi:MAG TPA: SGNH/GDSL hydrolase family protein [Candidatus Limnocylindrales bacterium]|nr:SGNH/GDSL hydrolase family protein [Candidatus Limnocylindrales bacterium]